MHKYIIFFLSFLLWNCSGNEPDFTVPNGTSAVHDSQFFNNGSYPTTNNSDDGVVNFGYSGTDAEGDSIDPTGFFELKDFVTEKSQKVPCENLYNGIAFTYMVDKYNGNTPKVYKGRPKFPGSVPSRDIPTRLWDDTHEKDQRRVVVPIADEADPTKVALWAVFAAHPETRVLNLNTKVKKENGQMCNYPFYSDTLDNGINGDDTVMEYILNNQNDQGTIAQRAIQVGNVAKFLKMDKEVEDRWTSAVNAKRGDCDKNLYCDQIEDVLLSDLNDNSRVMSQLGLIARQGLRTVSSKDDALIDELRDYFNDRYKTRAKVLIQDYCHLAGVVSPHQFTLDHYRESLANNTASSEPPCVQSTTMSTYAFAENEHGQDVTGRNAGAPHCITKNFTKNYMSKKNLESADLAVKVVENAKAVGWGAARMLPGVGTAIVAVDCAYMRQELPLRGDYPTTELFDKAKDIHIKRIRECYLDVALSSVGEVGGALKLFASLDDASKFRQFAAASPEMIKKIDTAGNTLSLAAGSGFAAQGLYRSIVDGPSIENLTNIGMGVMDLMQLGLRPARKVQQVNGKSKVVKAGDSLPATTATKCSICVRARSSVPAQYAKHGAKSQSEWDEMVEEAIRDYPQYFEKPKKGVLFRIERDFNESRERVRETNGIWPNQNKSDGGLYDHSRPNSAGTNSSVSFSHKENSYLLEEGFFGETDLKMTKYLSKSTGRVTDIPSNVGERIGYYTRNPKQVSRATRADDLQAISILEDTEEFVWNYAQYKTGPVKAVPSKVIEFEAEMLRPGLSSCETSIGVRELVVRTPVKTRSFEAEIAYLPDDNGNLVETVISEGGTAIVLDSDATRIIGTEKQFDPINP